MLIAQFVFGLIVIVLGLALLGLIVSGAAWVVLVLFQRLPLIGRRHRHTRWDELNRTARSDE
jgi:hypothetical protein